ncbi:MAG: outer membrane protein assembly factor BamC [Cardiobacteriaceae bacterium]|nr:outer membrane protein assembly factor BamC [Cardiobacteriaceae bacterium]
MKKRFLLGLVTLLTACNGNQLVPDRSPDYRQSKVGKQLVLPPNFVRTGQQDQLIIPQLGQQTSIATYQDYEQNKIRRDQRGFIEVLPELYGVQVIEPSPNAQGQSALPFIVTQLGIDETWQATKRFWEQQGVALDVQDTALGVMETAWLEDTTKLPKTGLSSMLSFLYDTGERDRYRLRFSREGSGTKIVLMHRKSEDLPSDTEDNTAFRWVETQNINPEYQIEMTRRLAVQLSQEVKRQQGSAHSEALYQLTQIDGQPALHLNLAYQSAFKAVGIALDRASFALENKDAKRGLYRVQYQPQKGKPVEGIFHQWFAKKEKTQENPHYHVRLAEQGKKSTLVLIHDENGQAVSQEEAQALLDTIIRYF